MDFPEITRLWRLQQENTIEIRDMDLLLEQIPKAQKRDSMKSMLQDAASLIGSAGFLVYAIHHAMRQELMRASFLLVALLSAAIGAIALVCLVHRHRAASGCGTSVQDQLRRALSEVDTTIQLRKHNLWLFLPVFGVWAIGAAEKTMTVETPVWWPAYLAGCVLGFPIVYWSTRRRLNQSLEQLRQRRSMLIELLRDDATTD